MTTKRRRVDENISVVEAGTSNSNGTKEDDQGFNLTLAQSLISACLSDDLPTVSSLISIGADAWFAEPGSGWTSLHAAAYVGNVEMVMLLLRKGNAVWNLVDELGFTAADIAWSMNYADVYEYLFGEGVRAEMITAVLPQDETTAKTKSTTSDNETFLKSKLRFTKDDYGQEICVDAEGQGVMMGWETDIMKETSRLLTEDCEACRAENDEYNVLNVGFGLGIIDELLQKDARPTNHLIIEPHPDVLNHAREKGWFDRPGVRFYQGTWQQYLRDLEEEEESYMAWDAVYFDTYSEHYRDLHAFFDCLPNLLRDGRSKFSFFHGLGATNRFFYDVYTTVSELHLKDCGLVTRWSEVETGIMTSTWQGTEKRYWGEVGPYRLPICNLAF